MARLSGALAAVLVGVALLASPSQDGSAAAGDVQLALVGTFAAPTYVTAPPGDGTRLFVVEQAGRIRLMKNGGAPTLFLDIASLVRMEGERGLLSMAFAPDYGASGRFYVYYTSNAVAGRALGDLVIAEYTVSADPDVANPSGRIVLSIPHPRSNHNGGQLQFGPDGYLYIGIGDGGGGGDPDRAGQSLGTLLGKLLRIDPRASGGAAYTVPPDNPFVGQTAARAEIWSYGLRNPWRFSFDRQTGDLTVADVGQNAWEEVNFVPAAVGRGRGVNFGWGCWEGRHTYSPNAGLSECNPPPAQAAPVHEYSHSRGCSITGGYVVRDPTVPQLVGRYVYGDYCTSPVWSIALQVPDGVGDTDTGLDLGSTYSFGEDACGRVYIASGGGEVRRLQIEGAAAPAACAASAPSTPPPPPPGGPPPPPPLAAKPPAICRVPRVIGMRLQPAQARIRRARCRVGRIRRIFSVRRRGVIISQSPRPASRRIRGTRVHFTVSRGRR